MIEYQWRKRHPHGIMATSPIVVWKKKIHALDHVHHTFSQDSFFRQKSYLQPIAIPCLHHCADTFVSWIWLIVEVCFIFVANWKLIDRFIALQIFFFTYFGPLVWILCVLEYFYSMLNSKKKKKKKKKEKRNRCQSLWPFSGISFFVINF